MRRVIFHPRARRDFDEIVDFISEDNPAQALSFIDDLEDACRRRAQFPKAGKRCDHIAPGLLRFPYKNYVIYYRTKTNGIIEIIHVLHSARGHESIMRNEG
ncbi:type II toxin-antitoxin system RelE/ParE family toxin [Nitrospirillum pindoramense]|uniref:type II toxin-antitoxin system RelE/ParE family toxin n=1 Tax=Nitrospirillum amazonense TaxID=28077 RepID=UPI00119F7156